ncbi:MAG: ABC-F family ATP-binding cassette domain-containing protein [Myxococcota bacterium]
MTIVQTQAVHKSYGPRVVLAAVDVAIQKNERIGVVGRNGAGKSTLARIIAGLEQPDSGSVSRMRGASVEYLSQTPRFEGDPTALEALLAALGDWTAAVARYEAATHALASGAGNQNLLLEEQQRAAEGVERLGGWQQQHRAEALLGHLGVTRPNAKILSMSGGEQRRVALARLLIARPDLAILDEPTNHLDAETVEWLENYLIDEHEGAVLLITHDRYLLDRVAERTLEVAGGNVYSYAGGYELYLEQKAEREEHAARTEQNRQNFLRRELEWLRRQPKARSTKQKARVERAEAAKATVAPREQATAKFSLETSRAGKTILEARGVSIEIAGRELVSGLDLFLTQGEIIGVVGRNGAGKTSLLRAIVGELPVKSGSLTVGQNTKIGYFDQKRSGLDEEKSVFENVAGDDGKLEGGRAVEPRVYLEQFGFDSGQQRQPVGSLSGGERARVALARLLRRVMNLLLLDEPTNDLDVATLGSLETLLLESGATALVVTHDRWFLDRVASGILCFEGEGKVVLYSGNYETFRRLRAARDAEKTSAPARDEAEPKKKAPQAKPKRLSRAEEQELAALPDQIEVAEATLARCQAELADPTTHTQGRENVQRATASLAAAEGEVTRLMARWEELEQKRAALASDGSV